MKDEKRSKVKSRKSFRYLFVHGYFDRLSTSFTDKNGLLLATRQS